MHEPPTYISWKITCHTSGEAQALGQWLSSRVDLDRVLTDTVRITPNGVEQVQTVRHRLRDYFADIRLLTDSQGDSIRIVFQRLAQAGRFWKDLMVNIVQEIEATYPNASIELESKGERKPIVSAKQPS